MTDEKTTRDRPSPLRWIVALASLAALGAALAAMLITAQAGVWLTFSFQGVIALAGVLGILQGLGRFREGPSIAALCFGGVFFVASFLGYYGAGGKIGFGALLRGNMQAFSPGELPTWALLVELGASGLAVAAAGLYALGRSPGKSWRQLGLGIALGAPVVIGGAAAYKLHLAQKIGSMNMIAGTLVSVILFVVVVGLLSASANAFIRAFSAGLPGMDDGAPAEAGKPVAAGSKVG